MRKTWLAVIPVVLLTAAPLLAQHARNRGTGTWAVIQTAAPPVPAANPPAAVHNAPVLPGNAPAGNGSAAVNGAPVAGQAAAPAGCCAGCQREPHPIDWQRLRDWLCYQPLKGGCPKKGSCGCNCSVPLYVYFLGTCKEGRKYELPPCVSDNKPGIFRQMCDDARGLFGSIGSGPSCPSYGCGETGHQLLGR